MNAYAAGNIPDYQMAALTMAIYFQGLDREETRALTDAMLHSGATLDLSHLRQPRIDKHSTGGVGDKVSLILAPLVASLGVTVPMMSGRGLGHTGGTLDKLESIPGFRTALSLPETVRQLEAIGCALIGATGDIAPADRRLYALRDATATVESIPLIAASIMSKKLAAGSDAIVLDVKVGSGAFMKTEEDAKRLAELMVKMGKHLKREVVAVVTDMNQPLGLSVGNALEFREAVQLLSGQLPAGDPLLEVCLLLSTHMLLLSKLATTEEEARAMLQHAIDNGAGLNKLRAMIHELGGDETYLTLEGMDSLCVVKRLVPVAAQEAGYIVSMQAELIGRAAQVLGAGRATKEDTIDPAVGLIMHKRVGAKVEKGEAFCTLYVNNEANLEDAIATMREAVCIGKKPDYVAPMVYGVIR